jgi:hypothetical protein
MKNGERPLNDRERWKSGRPRDEHRYLVSIETLSADEWPDEIAIMFGATTDLAKVGSSSTLSSWQGENFEPVS